MTPNLLGKVAAEEAPYLFRAGVLAVEKPPRGEVVGLLSYPELLIRGEGVLWVVLKVTKTTQDVLSSNVSIFRGNRFLLSPQTTLLQKE